MKKLQILGVSLFLLMCQQELAFGKTAEETINSSKFILNLGIGVIMTFVVLAIVLTASGWLVDALGKSKIKYYIEIWGHLLPIISVIGLIIYIFYQIKNVATLGM